MLIKKREEDPKKKRAVCDLCLRMRYRDALKYEALPFKKRLLRCKGKKSDTFDNECVEIYRKRTTLFNQHIKA